MRLETEKHFWQQGWRLIGGLDEAGRGALSGPVVAAVVVVKEQRKRLPKELSWVNDSKKLSWKKREELYCLLIDHPLVEWAIGRVGSKVIDRINILQATKLAMKRAVRNLEKKIGKKLDFVIVDGNFGIDLKVEQISIVKADQKVFSCAAASIISKVTRDRMMIRYHRKYCCYGFDKHKGYGTRFHRAMLRKHGSCFIHRKSFKLF
jgi:ribonuclease HII